jgi:NAD(P)-dependent dehydrogenase (short-subunit alcohol dehydrogenase family)
MLTLCLKVFLCQKHEIEQMLKQELVPIFDGEKLERNVRGSIVNTCSLAGFSVQANLAAYTSTKHAVLVLTRVDARQFAPHQIRVNSICPGFVPTPLMSGAGMPDSFYEAVKLESPQNRMTAPEEIAEGVVFLSESRAAGITGINLSVDSGAALYHAY